MDDTDTSEPRSQRKAGGRHRAYSCCHEGELFAPRQNEADTPDEPKERQHQRHHQHHESGRQRSKSFDVHHHKRAAHHRRVVHVKHDAPSVLHPPPTSPMGQHHHHLGGRTSPNPRLGGRTSPNPRQLHLQGHLWVRPVASPPRQGHTPVLANPAGAAASQSHSAMEIDLPLLLPLHDPMFRQVSESPELLTHGEMAEKSAPGTLPFEAPNHRGGIMARKYHPSFGENGKLIQPRHRPTIT